VKEFWTRYGWWLLLIGIALIALIGSRFRRERVDQFARHEKERQLIQVGMTPEQVKATAVRSPDGPDRWHAVRPETAGWVPGAEQWWPQSTLVEQSSDEFNTITIGYKDGQATGFSWNSQLPWDTWLLESLARGRQP
jgi:hypothetical protein